jgi:hypothetical protein
LQHLEEAVAVVEQLCMEIQERSSEEQEAAEAELQMEAAEAAEDIMTVLEAQEVTELPLEAALAVVEEVMLLDRVLLELAEQEKF